MARSKVTPEQILREAARLFATKGFHGTSTREIADAVGVRQPSLFHHFATKHDIARALYAYDHERSPGLRGARELPEGTPASVEFYQSVRREILVEMTSAYDLRGLYLSALIDEPEFREWRTAYDAAMARSRDVIERGVADGEFVATRADVVIEMLDATINQAVRWSGRPRDPSAPDDVAVLALRLVIARPSRIPAIRRQADRLLAAAGTPWADQLATQLG
ncbi:TetR/AcrR family transcriptional regulator [Nocardioides nitrophenolicus]|uniref:TetR/AcrR family transcriptional regulator n=1 Tax=Nocardioides nitrophenolicus TaxID=60489 RepID=UPI0019592D9F|nr:TetR/AcrR family transcriptional regulator [Nocardioides nitrophenolicus]MBM7518645.1 AcrR family transcriptional regulator [Nocardioides nitrophenolicus]